MKFELDEYYFNRAGDKVRYVGLINTSPGFRGDDGIVYAVSNDGRLLPCNYHDLDILGKWEITDDPDRVYVLKDGSECAAEYIWRHLLTGFVQKILIKPRKKWNDSGEMHKAIYSRVYDRQEKIKELLGSMAHLKKIESLNDLDKSFAGLTERKLIEKINELIAAHNCALK